MAERPILFSAPMVLALLAGRKTMTRRLATNRAAACIEVGDVLWVREAWYSPPFLGSDTCLGYMADGVPSCPHRGRPSIHMPRHAARISLLVTGKRVELVQDITEEDARAEGVDPWVPGHGTVTQSELAADPGYSGFLSHRLGFEMAWRSIYGESWERNDWIWRIAFERTEAPAREGGR